MDFDEDFKPILNKTAEKYRAKIQSVIKYCDLCQSFDGSEVLWLWGQKLELEELLFKYKIPEKYIDDIVPHLFCGGCHNPSLDRCSYVSEEDIYDVDIRKNLKEIDKKFKKEIDDFTTLITEYPSLALSHRFGRRIYKTITTSKLPTCNINGTWYRCRKKVEDKNFTSNDILAPQTGISSLGRFNHSGQSLLYIAEYEEVAYKEVMDDAVGQVLMQEIRIDKHENVLDLTSEWNNFHRDNNPIIVALLVNKLVDQKVVFKESKWKPEYFIPTLISDCARKSGYQGIKYKSTKSYECNVVLFDKSSKNIIPQGEPFLYSNKDIKENSFSSEVDF